VDDEIGGWGAKTCSMLAPAAEHCRKNSSTNLTQPFLCSGKVAKQKRPRENEEAAVGVADENLNPEDSGQEGAGPHGRDPRKKQRVEAEGEIPVASLTPQRRGQEEAGAHGRDPRKEERVQAEGKIPNHVSIASLTPQRKSQEGAGPQGGKPSERPREGEGRVATPAPSPAPAEMPLYPWGFAANPVKQVRHSLHCS